MQLSLILLQFVKMLVFYCKFVIHHHSFLYPESLFIDLTFPCLTNFSYENSKMSENQISELVTQTLAAVGLKVS